MRPRLIWTLAFVALLLVIGLASVVAAALGRALAGLAWYWVAAILGGAVVLPFVVGWLVLRPVPKVPGRSVLCLRAHGALAESPAPAAALPVGQGRGPTLFELCGNLRKAAVDPRVSSVYLRIGALSCGWAKLEELRRYIGQVREAGKQVVAYLEAGAEKEYLLGASCDELYAPPEGHLALTGLRVQTLHLRGLLDHLGVEPEVERIGEFKSAGDMLAGRAMSEPVREMMTALLDDQFARLVASVAQARGRAPAEVEALIDDSPTDVTALAEGGWISGVKYEDEVIDLLKERNGDTKDLRRLESAVYTRVPPASLGLEGRRTIAVLRVTGAIVHGKDGFSPLFGRTVGSEDFIPLVRAARRDDRVAAVVLRVDSPGGSGLASDLIWREIRATAAKKPVVASLSDVAGSGGYYVAMAADAIVAAPSTLTGSIGVVMAKLNLQALQERYGWKREVLSRGRLAELDVTHRSMSEEERRRFEKLCRDFYTRFVAKAAECRRMSAEQLEAHAQGRVWTGAMAMERGLVDALGGLQAAVDLAREKAKIPAGEKVRLRELRKPAPLLQRLAQRAGGASLLAGLPGALPGALPAALPGALPGALPAAVRAALTEELLPFGAWEPIALMDPAWWLGR